MNDMLQKDGINYGTVRKVPLFQRLWRHYQHSPQILKPLFKVFYKIVASYNKIEIPCNVRIGPGLFINHAYGITINPDVVIGSNCHMHKGVTIGQENRGRRKGVPTIGDNVWIGMNVTIVGNIQIGNDVLIAPNTYVNCDIPDYSVVLGNPCMIKHRDHATEGYI